MVRHGPHLLIISYRFTSVLVAITLLTSALLVGLIKAQTVVAEVPGVEWIRQLGTSSDDWAPAVSADSSGVYIALGTADDSLVCRYDASGTQIWSRQTSNTTDLKGYTRGVSAYSGGIYVTGSALTLASEECCGAFARKYDVNGNKLWTDPVMGILNMTKGQAISADSSGTYVAGYTLDTTAAYSSDAFVIKYDGDGNRVWTRLYATDASDNARGVSAYAGGIYVAGDTNGEAEGFVRKYDSDGNEVWTRLPGFAETTLVRAISVDSTGVYIAGEARDPSGAQGDAFVRKYDLNGVQVWTRQFGSSSNDSANAIFASATGIYVAGYTDGTLTGQTSQGGRDAFVCKYDTNGIEAWTYQFGSSAADTVSGISGDATAIYVSGDTQGALPGQSNLGLQDAFVAKMVVGAFPNNPPAQPTNVSPSNGVTGVSLTPALQSSAFSDPDVGDAHAASQWQIRASGGSYSTPVFDTGSDSSHLTQITLPSGALIQGTSYYWHARHQDSLGLWSSWSPETSFTTIDAITLVISQVAATSITATSATINWTTNAPATSQVEYGLTTLYGSMTPIDANLVTSHSVVLTGLTPGTTYHYRVKSTDVLGHPAQSGDNTLATSTSPLAVTTNDATSITTTSAILNATLTSMGTASTVQVSFEWGLTASYGSTTVSVSRTATGTLGVKLTALSPNTAYHFRAKAVGDGTAYGADKIFTTAGAGAPAVITSGATNVAATSATLNGVLTSMGTASTVQVSFEWGTEAGSYGNSTGGQAMTSIGSFSLGLIGLVPGTTYYYRAKAAGDGDPVYGDEMSFLTPTDAPPPGGNCWAVIVGVANYKYGGPYEGDLNYTDDDARALYDVLSPIWGESHVKLLLSAQATKAGIQSAISSWLEPLEDSDDTVLFFFSGHGGYVDWDLAPIDEVDGRDEYIVPYEASYVEDTILDDQLKTWLSGLEAARQVVIINSCFSGGFIDDLSWNSRVIITGGEEDESTWETPALGHSVFPYFLLEGFEHLDVLDANANNEISVEEFFIYAQPRTTDYEITQDYPSIQHPQISDGYGGELGLFTLATLTIDASPRVTSVTLDGQARSSSDLPVSVDFLPGTNHSFTFSVETTIGIGVQQPKYTFLWWDDGVTSSERTVNISQTRSYAADYSTQYFLDIESDLANLEGEGWYEAGLEVSLYASVVPQESSGTRNTFLTWSIDGADVSGNPIIVKMDSARTVTALCTTEYELTVLSDRGETQGSGWYEAGSTATVSVDSSLGSIVRHVFAGWSGDSTSEERNTTVLMSRPRTIEALWQTDYSRVYMLGGGVLIAAGILTAAIALRMRRRRRREWPQRPPDRFI